MTFSVLMTDHYKSFSCTGSACVHNCCQNWRIELSRADYNKIRSAKKSAELETKLKQGMKRFKSGEDEKYAFFITSKQQCAMLREDGLCELQAECGHQVLPVVCRVFPRNVGSVKGLNLRACSAGCPEIMKDLMLRENPLTFISDEETVSGIVKYTFTVNEATHPVARHYSEVLEVCVDILQNRATSLRERVIALGMALSALDKIEQAEKNDGPQETSFEGWKKQYAALGTQTIEIEPTDCHKAIVSNLILSQQIGVNDAAIAEINQRIFATLGAAQEKATAPNAQKDANEQGQVEVQITVDNQAYTKAKKTLSDAYDVDAMLENIMVNYLFSMGVPFTSKSIWQDYLYFCQVYSYLQFAAIGCYAPEKGPEKSTDRLIRDLTICYRCMAHSLPMKKIILDHMKKNECTTLAHMAMLVSS